MTSQSPQPQFQAAALENLIDMNELVRIYKQLSDANFDKETMEYMIANESAALVSSVLRSEGTQLVAAIAERADRI
ncbi:hypothetical protein [uncultured Nostoc sp.]|uniref:hypothetical protein n=1 Tax=uncultured Nostoc sp. TaxID=340711 RepID=UPI0035CC95EA